jgi:hypothetical protein
LNHRRKECQIAGWAKFLCGPIAAFLPCNDPEVKTTTPGKLGNDKHDPQKASLVRHPESMLEQQLPYPGERDFKYA